MYHFIHVLKWNIFLDLACVRAQIIFGKYQDRLYLKLFRALTSCSVFKYFTILSNVEGCICEVPDNNYTGVNTFIFQLYFVFRISDCWVYTKYQQQFFEWFKLVSHITVARRSPAIIVIDRTTDHYNSVMFHSLQQAIDQCKESIAWSTIGINIEFYTYTL